MKLRLSLAAALAASTFLAACLDDPNADPVAVTSTHESNRVGVISDAMSNYALSGVSAVSDVGVLNRGAVGQRSLVCAMGNGTTAGVFLVWMDELGPVLGGTLSAELVRRVGASNVGRWYGGKLIMPPAVPSLPEGCQVPAGGDGAPVIALPVKIPQGVLEAATAIETRTQNCPTGYRGIMVEERRITYTRTGSRNVGDWHDTGAGGCELADTVETDVVPFNLSMWPGDEELLGYKEDGSVTCKRVTVRNVKGGEAVSSKTFVTCDTTPDHIPATFELPSGPVRRPHPQPLPVIEKGVCTGGGVAGIVRLPAMTKPDYATAITDMADRLDATYSAFEVDCVQESCHKPRGRSCKPST